MVTAAIRTKTKRTVQQVLHAVGLDVKFYTPHPAHALSTLLDLYQVETIFDIGANAGMSGQYFRNLGFQGKIVSFEPVTTYFRQLEQAAAGDPLWLCEKLGLADQNGESEINVSGGCGGASSFLNTVGHIEANNPELAVIARERVKVETLESVIQRHYPTGDRLFLKIDAQGFEKRILQSTTSLDRVVGMRVELSVVQSYENEPLMSEMLNYMYDLGYRLCGVEEGWSNQRSQEVFQIDAMLFRTEKCAGLAH